MTFTNSLLFVFRSPEGHHAPSFFKERNRLEHTSGVISYLIFRKFMHFSLVLPLKV